MARLLKGSGPAPRQQPKKGRKSVDSVEKAGVKRVRPVDNPLTAVVSFSKPLVQSAALTGSACSRNVAEKAQLEGVIAEARAPGGFGVGIGYPQLSLPVTLLLDMLSGVSTTEVRLSTDRDRWKAVLDSGSASTCVFDSCSMAQVESFYTGVESIVDNEENTC
jgi:hypothetical protein